ncbi:MAG: HAMP domain-containing protein [Geobacter sp.]|nr:HAMP domain-containing protein [Geobacter sp.]
MNLYIGIRTKLLLAVFFLLVISFSILLVSTLVSIDSFVVRQIDTELAEQLGYVQHHFYERTETVRDSLGQQLTSPTMQEHLRADDRIWLSAALQRWKAILPFLDLFSIVNADQMTLARLNTAEPVGRFAMPDLLDKAFSEKKPVVSTELVSVKALSMEAGSAKVPLQSVNGGVMMVTLVLPVIDATGKVIGAVVAGDVLNGDNFLPIQYRSLFGDKGEIMVSQFDTTIVSSSRQEMINGTRVAPEIMEELKSGQAYYGRVETGEMPYRSSYVPILNGRGGFIGSLAVAVSTADYQKIRNNTKQNVLNTAVVSMMLLLVIAVVISRKLAEPLRRLARGVRMIEAGDLEQQVEVTSSDEVGQLARSFNSMVKTLAERKRIIESKTDDLQKLNERLEKIVTERTSQLQLEMGMLETVLTCMAEGMVVVDSQGCVVRFNPAAQKIFDIVPCRVIGHSLTQLADQEGFAELIRFAQSVGADEEGMGGAGERTIHVKGKQLQVSVSQLVECSGERAGVVVSLRDVTAEAEVDRMKSDFISTVSHELKTPLTSIKGALQFIMNKGKWLTTTERELINVCLRNSDRLSRLISDILDISKIEAGRVELILRPESANELVVNAIEEIKGVALARGITVINSVPVDLPLVYGDHDRLVQVLTNLLSNAVKFSPEQKVVVVSAVHVGNYVTISVTDSGRPIQWADRDKLFRKFQQIERDDMGTRGGTGLGLAICKEIVERHHGRIYYENSQSGGNVFSFTVPVCEESHEG